MPRRRTISRILWLAFSSFASVARSSIVAISPSTCSSGVACTAGASVGALLTETNIRGTLRKRVSFQGSDSRTITLTRAQLDDLNAIVGYAAVDARFPHKKRLQAVLKQIAELFGADSREMLARRARSKAAKPIPRRKTPKGLSAGKAGDGQAIYQLKITLLDTAPPIWRRIQIEDCTLDTLHHHIQAVMEWTNSHMHHFWIGKKRYGRPSLNVGSLPENHVIDSTQIRLSDILPANGKKMRFGYEYDFGDCWEHEIQFERVVEPDPKARYPICIEGERAGPPDTCGGVPGYEYLLEVLADPSHEGCNLDPETAAQVIGFLEEFNAEGRTIVMVTHDPRAAQRARRVIRLVEGRLVDDGGLALPPAAVKRGVA
jgi:hypothetical protein